MLEVLYEKYGTKYEKIYSNMQHRSRLQINNKIIEIKSNPKKEKEKDEIPQRRKKAWTFEAIE